MKNRLHVHTVLVGVAATAINVLINHQIYGRMDWLATAIFLVVFSVIYGLIIKRWYRKQE